ncbi:MAG: HEAT repeat domain-containing protein [Candidatus Coatesbacteria bacterium]|nr:MAG: HEAT repeat domain-containing protein [Candidatus Coatesbacteria bacterium]
MAEVNELIEDLADDDSAKQAAAVEQLVALGPEALGDLSAALQNGSPVRRQGAAVAMGRIGDAAAVEALQGALDDSDENVKKAAAWALKKLGA